MDTDSADLLSTSLGDRRCGFSIGGFGALAEFQDDALQVLSTSGDLWTAASRHGALQIDRRVPAETLAYEALAAAPDTWQHGVCLWGPVEHYRMSARTVLTELGADTAAVFDADRAQLLFDLGAGLPHVDFCLRTAEPALLKLLRRHIGQAVIGDGHPVMEAVIDASPQRVAISRLARIEVFQRIDRHRTPCGPHTHLLPALLSRRRTHSANIPLPGGSVPLLTLHPEHPLHDADGRRRPFQRTAFERFEGVLERFGDHRYTAEKMRLRAAIERGDPPQAHAPARSRSGRLAQRVALRQLPHTLSDPTLVLPWQAHFRP
ncbi:MAG: hypothetical protein WD928_13785 [Gammaproteobacteria bacterium]